MKYLYANGCSFVYGAELKYPERDRWSKKLSDRFELKELNYAKNGSSNKRILRKTKQFILDDIKRATETFFVIGWTQTCRTELYNSVVKKYQSINRGVQPKDVVNENGSDASGEAIIGKTTGYFLGKSPGVKFWKENLTYYCDNNNMIEESVNYIFCLQEIMKKFNLKYYFFSSMENGILEIINEQYKQLFDLDKVYFQSQEDWISGKDGCGFSGSHPNVKSHFYWSKLLYNKYTELYGETNDR
jgi:hypothetical protein|tara:strand:- start:515 stop:1246 length:732 start_codon:yes stop_codon:yes gene_type:complete